VQKIGVGDELTSMVMLRSSHGTPAQCKGTSRLLTLVYGLGAATSIISGIENFDLWYGASRIEHPGSDM